MSDLQRETVNDYAHQLYRRYIKRWAEDARKGVGFYQYANAGIGELIYAAWIEDKELAAATFNKIFQDIDDKFFDDGYINNNSFRGVRGFWYHTYGVNSALAVIGLAEAWRVPVPKRVLDKIVAAVQLINVGVRDLNEIRFPKFFRVSRQCLHQPQGCSPTYSPDGDRHRRHGEAIRECHPGARQDLSSQTREGRTVGFHGWFPSWVHDRAIGVASGAVRRVVPTMIGTASR